MTEGILTVSSILFALKLEFAYQEWKNSAKEWKKIWREKWFYVLLAVNICVFYFLYLVLEREMVILQYLDLLMTYVLLAAVDMKRRLIPNSILICMGAGQFLCGIFTMGLSELLSGMLLGLAVYVILLLLTVVSRGGFGLGDAKLLALTAVFTGGSYLLQIIFWGLICAFMFSVFLLAYKKGNRKTELPFVPFLACGMLIHMGVWLLC